MVDVGSSLHGMYGEYKLKAKLGDGLTGRVFAADHPTEGMEVAVKVLKPNLPVATIRSFMLEARHIAEVSTAVEKWIKRQPTGDVMADQVATPPKFYEMHEATGPDDATFQVMELMQGQQMEERGSLPEAIGLRLGIQLFGLLAVLHEEARRTYTDFKFENLWWEPYGQRLRVTDWNVVSEEGNLTDVALDLERATRALVRVLTGTAMTSGQRLVQQPRWETLSEGARRLFSQALHPDRARRPQSAAEMRKELVRLAGYWQPERPARVLQRVELILDAVEQVGGTITVDPASQQTLLQAVGMLGVLRLRREQEPADDQWPSETVEELNTLWQRSTMLLPTAQTQIEKAKHMLDAGSAPVALDLLRQAALDFPDELAVHRWLAVAETVDQRRPGAGDTALLKQSIELCEQGKYATAQERLIPVAKIVPDTLQQDIDFQLAWNDAIDEKSELKYRLPAADRAAGHLAALKQRSPDYANAVRVNTETDVDKYGDALRQEEAESLRQQRVEKYIAKVEEAIDLKNPTRVITVVEGEFKSFADDPRAVEVTLDLAQFCLGARKYPDAWHAYSVGKDLAAEAGDVFRLGSRVSHACQELTRYRASDKVRKEVDDAITHLLNARADLPISRLTPLQEALAQAVEDGIVATAALKKDDATKAMNDLDAFRAHLRSGQAQPMLARLQSVLAEAMLQNGTAAQGAVSQALGMPDELLPALVILLAHESKEASDQAKIADTRREALRTVSQALEMPTELLPTVVDLLTDDGKKAFGEAKTVDARHQAFGTMLGAGVLVDALSSSLGQEPTWDTEFKTKLHALARNVLKLSAPVEKILRGAGGLATAKNEQEAQIALAKNLGVAAKNDVSVQIALATAAGMPGATAILEGLFATCDAAERRKLAVVYRGLADRLDPARHPTVSADDDEQHRTVAPTGSPTTKPFPNANATSSGRSSITADSQLTAEDALQALQSNDPKLWQMATSKQPSEQAQWGAQARDLITQRTKTLLEHWRDMDRAFSLLATSPTTAKETIQKWERLYSITSCWDSRKSAWVPTDQLLQEIMQISDTRQAEQWLKQAKDNADRGKIPEARDRIASALTQFPNAADEVLQRLRELQEDLQRRALDRGADPNAGSPENLLKRAIQNSETLTELRKRLGDLIDMAPTNSGIFSQQYGSLKNWEEREIWMSEVERQVFSTTGELKLLPTAATRQAAESYLVFLDRLRDQAYWRNYIPANALVFAKTQQRLERIARSFDPK